MLDSSGHLAAMENTRNSRVIQFGAFEIDSRAGELRKNGLKVRIQQQPLEVLTALLDRPGEVVSRDELHARLWPNDTFVDFERGLNAAVRRLREALGESAEQPVFIETLSKRGYRFIGHVSGNGTGQAHTVEVSKAAPSKPRSKRLVITAAAAMLAAVIATTATVLVRMSRQPAVVSEQLETRLTTNSAENPVDGAAISPDGNHLAYSDATGLYLKLVSTGETHAIVLPAGFFAIPVGWFPDGSHLLISGGTRDADRGLWSLSLYGGMPRKLIDSALSGSVSPNGQHIAVLRGSPDWGDFGNEIWTIDPDGSNPVRLVSPISDSAIGEVAWGPDSKHLVYTLTQWGGHVAKDTSIRMASLAQPDVHTIFSNKDLGSALEWLPDRRLIYIMREAQPNQRDSNLWARHINARGKLTGAPVRLTRSPGWVSGISSSSDGKHLALLKNSWSIHLFLGQLSPDENRIRNVRRMTLEESSDLPTAWTSNGKTVLFSSDRNGHWEVFKQNIDQTQPELLASSKGSLTLPRLSPDGSEVLYISTPQDMPDYGLGSILGMPVNGGVARKIIDTRKQEIRNIECTREPANFCITNSVDGPRVTFFRFNPKTGVKSELTHIESDGPVNWGLSPDGAYLTILPYSPDNGSMTLYSIAKGTTRKFEVKGGTGLTTVDWAADSKSMFIGTLNQAGHIALLRVTLDGGVHVLREGTFPTQCGCTYWAIPSPDGKRIAMNEPGGGSNVWELNTK